MKQPQGNANLVASFPVQLLTAGTSACIADLCTFPLDTAKVRLQVIYDYYLIKASGLDSVSALSLCQRD